MVGIYVSGQLALLLGVLGALWIYLDGRKHRIETADMWAVGFFVGMFIPPILGAVVVAVLYVQKRNDGRRQRPLRHPR
jgi:hypothetical protein